MKIAGLEDKLRAIVEPVVTGAGLELVDVVYVTEHGRRILRVFIDKPDGITVDDCSTISRELSTLFDVEDPIPQRYTLEVSSPGLDRPLIKEADFLRYIGRKVRIKSVEAMDGRRNFNAVIDAVTNGAVSVTDFDGKKFNLSLSNIEKARLEIEI